MFAGIGGFRAGLTRAGGFQCVGHCEIDRYADASYRAIHDIREEEKYYPDAREIDPNDMPRFDLLCGGFPCQSWSAAGHRLGFADPRGAIFFEIARLAEARQPAYLLLENVPRILLHDKGQAFATILSTLHELGYGLEWAVLNSADHGVPQSRRRVYIVGYLDPRCAGKIFPLAGANGKALVQVLGGPQGSRVYDPTGVACTQTAGAGGMGGKTGLYLIPPDDAFVDLCAGEPRRTGVARCLTARYGQTTLSNHRAERSGVLLIKDAAEQSDDVAVPNDTADPDGRQTQNAVFVDLCKGRPVITSAARCVNTRQDAPLTNFRGQNSGVLLIKEGTRQGYKEAAPGDMVDLGYPGSKTRSGRVSKLAHDAASVQGIVDRGGRIRRLMPRECLRLQGFDEDQIDRLLAISSDAQAYKQAGNSVTVNVIEAIGRRIRAVDKALKEEDAA